MLQDQYRQLTVPLSPFIKRGQKKSLESRRLRPINSLDLKYLVDTLRDSEVASLNIAGKPWSVVSVYSPYSSDVHVMLVEMDSRRYLPAPENVPDDEGDALMEAWKEILKFTAERDGIETIHAGYNWSPRSWGKYEEQTGFQSVPTKWHPQLWGWQSFTDPNASNHGMKWISSQTLPHDQKRLFGVNSYADEIGFEIYDSLRNIKNADFKEIISVEDMMCDTRGVFISLNRNLVDLLSETSFFSTVLKPIANVLNSLFVDLTECFTELDCEEIDEILRLTENGKLDRKYLNQLRVKPTIRDIEYIVGALEELKISLSPIESLYGPIHRRCHEEGDSRHFWRKGFGYAMVLSSPADSEIDSTELRIMPGVYTGPGGVIEAQGVVLKRPEDKTIDQKMALERSEVLWELGDSLDKLKI